MATWLEGNGPHTFKLTERDRNCPEGRRIFEATGSDRGRLAVALLERSRHNRNPNIFSVRSIDFKLLSAAGAILKGKGCLAPEDFTRFIDEWQHTGGAWSIRPPKLAALAEMLVAEHGLTPGLRTDVERLSRCADRNLAQWTNSEDRKTAARLHALLGRRPEAFTEPWQHPFAEPTLRQYAEFAATATGKQPSIKWLSAAQAILAHCDSDRLLLALRESASEIRRMQRAVDALHGDMLRGLVWLASMIGGNSPVSPLGELALACGQKLPGIGARSVKGFNGCIYALERTGGLASLAELSKIKTKIKTPSLNATVIEALERAAAAQNLSIEELEELIVPTCGLETPGVRIEKLGGAEARLEITGSTTVEVRWFSGGREVKSVPAAIRDLPEVKELKAAKKEIEAALSAQKARLEGLLLSDRRIGLSSWRNRYLEQPLLSNMVRRLIWRFVSPEGDRLGIAPDGQLVDVEGEPFTPSESTQVQLWHPLAAGVSAIEAWRDFLHAHSITQPFKQAYREIYLLTDAERHTNTYSNRFAAHVLKQHQMAALMRQRGWKYQLMGTVFDNWNVPSLTLDRWSARAEFQVEPIEVPGEESASGVSLYVTTDQVRIIDLREGDMRLQDVPPLIFSEIMRDVDLFVGVCSVAQDPSWVDQGRRPDLATYWHGTAFGDLTASAETRKVVLQRLLPRLAIADRARIEGKFLIVKGGLRTYKIHLGSGNILMSPNDQYLCIVRGAPSPKTERLYLPFEGDTVLALILSKAFLLADDQEITDATIVRQIRR